MRMLDGPSLPARSGRPPDRLVVLLHGLGADGSDLIGLAPMLADSLPGAAFFAPDAPYPCDMAPYGRQWFSLQDRRPVVMLAGVQAVAPMVDQYLDDLLAEHGLPPAALALVGFSQGTMIALHIAPRRPQAIGALLGFSGALVAGERLADEAVSSPPVMLIHGDADEVVPVAALPAAVAGLQSADIPVQWIVRPGLPHSIDEAGIAAGARFLEDSLAG